MIELANTLQVAATIDATLGAHQSFPAGGGDPPDLNLMLVGPQHQGKSLLIGTLARVLENRLTVDWFPLAATSGSLGGTKTVRLTPYEHFTPRRYRVRLLDTCGYTSTPAENVRLTKFIRGCRETDQKTLERDPACAVHGVILVCRLDAEERELGHITRLVEHLNSEENNLSSILVVITCCPPLASTATREQRDERARRIQSICAAANSEDTVEIDNYTKSDRAADVARDLLAATILGGAANMAIPRFHELARIRAQQQDH